MDMCYAKQRNQPRYAIVAICKFSKHGDAQPMNNKENNSVYDALLMHFQTLKHPMGIYSDGG